MFHQLNVLFVISIQFLLVRHMWPHLPYNAKVSHTTIGDTDSDDRTVVGRGRGARRNVRREIGVWIVPGLSMDSAFYRRVKERINRYSHIR